MVALGEGILALARFVEDDPWWWGHILLGVCHGRCVRVMARGLEMCFHEDANVWSIVGSGCDLSLGVPVPRTMECMRDM